MAKLRIRELAKELDIQSKDIIDFLTTKGKGDGKKPASNIEDEEIELVRSNFLKGAAKADDSSASKAVSEKVQESKVSIKESDSNEKKVAKAESKDTLRVTKPDTEKKEAPKNKNISVYVYNDNSKGGDKKRSQRFDNSDRRGRDGKHVYRAGDAHKPIKPRTEPTARPRITVPEPKPVPRERVTAPVSESVPSTKPSAKNTSPIENKEQSVVETRTATENKPIGINVIANINDNKIPERISTPKQEARPEVKQESRKEGRPGRDIRDNKDNRDNRQDSRNPKNEGRPGDNRKKKQGQQQRDNQIGRKSERTFNLEKAAAKKRQKPQENKTVVRGEDEILTLILPERMTIKELSEKMKIAPSEVVKKLFMKGKMVTVNQNITYEQAEEIALEFNCICEPEEKTDVIAELLKEEEDVIENMVKRPPVVCVMGHVDHGKTSLLDAIRDTHMIDREAGGITQKIGAYMVSINGEKITFLDTPGHEAFTAMRMRGASSTDIAILVVAADDGVMPQTVEAINHAKAAEVEIIVAINKIDKPGANIDRVKKELAEYDLISEDWGGSTVFVPVSAHTHEGIDELLEMILLTAEVMELKADKKRNARGIVIEAELDKGRGVVATVLVQKGTLKVGDPVVAGKSFGKVRAMLDEHGRRIKKAGPSTPAEILGLSEVPNAGEIFMEMDSEREARSFADTFISVGKDKLIEDSRAKMSLDDLFTQIQEGNLKELHLIIKADVQGSVEALRQSLEKLSDDEVVVKIIHAGVGAITESDVSLASASNAIIIGFNVRVDNIANQRAQEEGIDVRLYKVIYNILEDIESAMKGMLEPIYEEKVIGHAVVRQVFKASDVGNIAGSYVTDGHIEKDCKVRISRRGDQIFEGSLNSLKRFKDNVKEVKMGFECGLVFEGFQEFMMDDEIEAYIMVEVARK